MKLEKVADKWVCTGNGLTATADGRGAAFRNWGDLMRMALRRQIETGPDAIVYHNFYHCPDCAAVWDSVWDSACNEMCECGLSNLSPFASCVVGADSPAKVETHTVPIISTSHMTPDVARAIAEDGDGNQWSIPVAKYGQGCVFLGCNNPQPSEAWPDCIRRIYAWATANGFYMVRLDADADQVAGLTFYHW